jgi:hypothetical protein
MADSFSFQGPNMDKFHTWLEKQKERILESVKESYILACTEAVNKARETDTYKDRTNNLRSSIGFVLYYNGELVHDDFKFSGTGNGSSEVEFTTKEGTDVSFTTKAKDSSGSAGIKSGQELAHEVAKRHPEGFTAVIVAGMKYALYVEAKGFDVLTGATLEISEEVRKNFEIIDKEHGTNFARG